jgi:hypothetical protein
MANQLTTASIWKSLRGSIIQVLTDESYGKQQYKDFCKEKKTDKAFVDILEVAGPTFLREKAQGAPMEQLQILEGPSRRIMMRTFAGKVQVSNEAVDDNEQEKVLQVAKKLKIAGIHTREVDCANLLNRFNNTSYVFGDGQPLASASHTLTSGGTFSNTLSVAQAPSTSAIQTMRVACSKLPGYNGERRGYMIEKIVCPVDQINAWEVILGSQLQSETANNALNNIKKLGIEVVAPLQWTGSTTAWGVLTDADEGLVYFERKAMESNTWVDKNEGVMNYSLTYRGRPYSTGARGHYWSEA